MSSKQAGEFIRRRFRGVENGLEVEVILPTGDTVQMVLPLYCQGGGNVPREDTNRLAAEAFAALFDEYHAERLNAALANSDAPAKKDRFALAEYIVALEGLAEDAAKDGCLLDQGAVPASALRERAKALEAENLLFREALNDIERSDSAFLSARAARLALEAAAGARGGAAVGMMPAMAE